MERNDSTEVFGNRVLDAVALHVKQEAVHGAENPNYTRYDPKALELKRRHLEGVLKGFRKDKTLKRNERFALTYVRHELRKVRVHQNPSIWNVFLRANPLIRLLAELIGLNRYYRAMNRDMKVYENQVSNGLNASELQQTLKEFGFNNQLEGPMLERMAYRPDEFSLRNHEVSKNDTNYTLHFKKDRGSNSYYFSGFDASHKPPRGTVPNGRTDPPPMEFRLTDNMKITAGEAQSLVHGNLVSKVIDGKKTVLSQSKDGRRLNASQFDLEKNLTSLPIKEWGDPIAREVILHDIAAGRESFVTLQLPGGEEKGLIVSMAKDKPGKGVQLEFRDENGKVDAFDLIKDRSVAQEILQNINMSPLLKNANHLRLA